MIMLENKSLWSLYEVSFQAHLKLPEIAVSLEREREKLRRSDISKKNERLLRQMSWLLISLDSFYTVHRSWPSLIFSSCSVFSGNDT